MTAKAKPKKQKATIQVGCEIASAGGASVRPGMIKKLYDQAIARGLASLQANSDAATQLLLRSTTFRGSRVTMATVKPPATRV